MYLTNENQIFGSTFSKTTGRKKINIYILIEHSKLFLKIYLFAIILRLVFLINDLKQAISYESLTLKLNTEGLRQKHIGFFIDSNTEFYFLSKKKN